MGLPWIQVATEVIEHAAPELAVVLEWNEDSALAGLVRLFRWAIGRCPDDRPPSAADVVIGKSAARLVATAAGYKGDPEAFVTACGAIWPEPILERTADGVRVLGLKRYDAAWAKANPTKAMEWRSRSGLPAKPKRNRSGTAPVRQAKIEIETETKKLLPSEVVVTPPPKSKSHQPLVYEAPTTPPDTWGWRDFFRWFQAKRIASGLLGEKWPNEDAAASWWNACGLTPGVTTKALQEGAYAYSDDPHWDKATPPWPFAGFMSQWAKYTKPEVKHGHAA